MKLSDNFSLHEFTRSQTATRHGIDNTPSKEIIGNLQSLCLGVLQPVRQHFQKPMIISSGYRCVELNIKIGGSITSQHVQGQAADIEVLEVSNLELSDWINKNLSFDQLILEFHNPDEDPHSGWVHVSFNSDNNRHEYKEAYKNEEGKTRYRLR
jgi:zinc D-Ala-D-Ala carboxypeptidase